MAKGQIQNTSLSPYLSILKDEISKDLRRTIRPEDLRDETRKVLFKEVLRLGLVALSEMDVALTYHGRDKIIAAECKLSRHIDYISEMIGSRDTQRIDVNHQLEAGDSTDAE